VHTAIIADLNIAAPAKQHRVIIYLAIFSYLYCPAVNRADLGAPGNDRIGPYLYPTPYYSHKWFRYIV
jgi:hypothetical protein